MYKRAKKPVVLRLCGGWKSTVLSRLPWSIKDLSGTPRLMHAEGCTLMLVHVTSHRVISQGAQPREAKPGHSLVRCSVSALVGIGAEAKIHVFRSN